MLGPDVAFSIPGLDQSLELEKIYQIISEIQRFGLFKSSDEISSDKNGVLCRKSEFRELLDSLILTSGALSLAKKRAVKPQNAAFSNRQ